MNEEHEKDIKQEEKVSENFSHTFVEENKNVYAEEPEAEINDSHVEMLEKRETDIFELFCKGAVGSIQYNNVHKELIDIAVRVNEEYGNMQSQLVEMQKVIAMQKAMKEKYQEQLKLMKDEICNLQKENSELRIHYKETREKLIEILNRSIDEAKALDGKTADEVFKPTYSEVEFLRWKNSGMLNPSEAAELATVETNAEAMQLQFGARLGFGTAGLRGIMALGPACMNRFTVGQATQGLADLCRSADLGTNLTRGLVKPQGAADYLIPLLKQKGRRHRAVYSPGHCYHYLCHAITTFL